MAEVNHIVILCSLLNVPGGYEKAVANTANLFASKGNKVTLLILDTPKESYYTLHEKINVIQKSFFFGITPKGNTITRKISLVSEILKLGTIFRQLKPDVVICSEYHLAIVTILAGARRFAKVYSWEHHHFYWLEKNAFWTFLLKKCYPRLNSIVCLNNDEKKHFKNFSAVSVIPNFTVKKSSLYSNQDSKLILSVCGLIPRKGIDVMLRAAKQILIMFPDWKWKLIGDGIMKEEVLKFIEEENLKDRFILQMPGGPDIEKEYLEASVFVLTSRFEAFPLVLLEALSFGLPCISTDCPSGPGEIIVQNNNGLLVEKENVNDLVNAISILVQDEKKRKTMSANAIQSSSRYLPDAVYKLWEEIF